MGTDFEKILDEVNEKAKEAVTNKGDYIGDNGLLYCGKCNTPKQCRINICGKIKTVYCLCQCGCVAQDKEREKARKKDRDEWIERMRATAFPADKFYKYTFANDFGRKPELTRVCKNYVEHFPEMAESGTGLLFYGLTGTGKSYAASMIANELISRGIPSLFVSIKSLVKDIRESFGAEKLVTAGLNEYKFLIIDDLGSESKTPYIQDIILDIIETRTNLGLPLIITTNISIKELKNPQSITEKRINDRILKMCFPVEVTGENYRYTAIKQDFEKTKNILYGEDQSEDDE